MYFKYNYNITIVVSHLDLDGLTLQEASEDSTPTASMHVRTTLRKDTARLGIINTLHLVS